MRYLKDPWLQIFGFLALASAVLAARGLTAAGARGQIAVSQPSPQATAAPLHRTLNPKKAGRWIVDAALATDADTAKLSEALANAAAGETIFVRAGTYRAGAPITRDVTLAGLGALRDVVVESDAEGPTLAVDGAKVAVKNLTIAHSGARPGKAVEARRATLELSGVAIRSGPNDEGVDAIGGSATLSYSSVDGGSRGLDAHDGAKVALDHARISGAETGVYLQGASARINDTSFSDGKKGLTVAEQAQADVVNGSFAREEVAVWADRGGQAKVSGAKFPDHAVGVLADERGRAEVKDCEFSNGSGPALAAETGGETLDRGSSILRGRTAARASGKATLGLVDTQIEDAKSDAVAIDDASAALSGVKIVRAGGHGLVVGDAQAVRIEKSEISKNKGAGIYFRGDQDLALDLDGSRLSGNAGGAIVREQGRRGRLSIRGKNNEPRDPASLIQ